MIKVVRIKTGPLSRPALPNPRLQLGWERTDLTWLKETVKNITGNFSAILHKQFKLKFRKSFDPRLEGFEYRLAVNGLEISIAITIGCDPDNTLSRMPHTLSRNLANFLLRPPQRQQTVRQALAAVAPRMEKELYELAEQTDRAYAAELGFRLESGQSRQLFSEIMAEAVPKILGFFLTRELMRPYPLNQQTIEGEINATISEMASRLARSGRLTKTPLWNYVSTLALLAVVGSENSLPETTLKCRLLLLGDFGSNLAAAEFLQLGLGGGPAYAQYPFLLTTQLAKRIVIFSEIFTALRLMFTVVYRNAAGILPLILFGPLSDSRPQ